MTSLTGPADEAGESPEGSVVVPSAGADRQRDLLAAIPALPKVLLHDHLDGGVRPATVVDLAADLGHALPTTDPAALGAWFRAAAYSGSLERYLETFAHTAGVMQTADGLRRVAREAVEDLAADGVVYAEERFAPELHTGRGLSAQQVVDAVLAGFDEGVRVAATQGRTIVVRALLTAMRQEDRWEEVAALAVASRDRGVVGFDLAGPEAGFPPDRHAKAFEILHAAWLPATVHAGEGDGPASIAGALRVGIGQTTVTVRTDGRRFVPDREVVTVQVGDMVLWHGLDGARPFVVRGEKEFFASDHLLNESGYTHVFSAPGRHAWADAHGSDLHGVVDVALPALGTAKDVAAWQARIAVGTVVTIADGVAEPAAVKVVVGQTVFFVVTKTGTGISITDTALLAGAAPDAPQPGRGSSSARRTAA